MILTGLHIIAGIRCPIFFDRHNVGTTIKVLQHEVLDINLGQIEVMLYKKKMVLYSFYYRYLRIKYPYGNPKLRPLDGD